MDEAMAQMVKNATKHALRDREEKSVALARNDLSEVINNAKFGDHVTVITRRNKPAAAVVPMWALDLLDELMLVARKAPDS
jgi:prevent-host-death family protein